MEDSAKPMSPDFMLAKKTFQLRKLMAAWGIAPLP